MKKRLALVIVLISSISIFSCKKVDDTYKNYTNTLDTFSGSSLQYIQSQDGKYDSMLFAINRVPGLSDSLSNDSITLFAISNNSFALALKNINSARLDSTPKMQPISLKNMNAAVLDTFLSRYIIRGKILSSDMLTSSDGIDLVSIKYDYTMFGQLVSTNASGFVGGGPKQIKFSDKKNSIFTRYWISVNTITSDIKTSNGIVNILPPGHDFGFGNDFITAVNAR